MLTHHKFVCLVCFTSVLTWKDLSKFSKPSDGATINERVRLFNAQNTGVTQPHLRGVYHLVSCSGTNMADRMVHLSWVREC